MKRQGGFTLIELVVVIVILGILAVTAAPKFLNLQSDARASSLQGLKGAMAGAAGIVYGKAAIEGIESSETPTSPLDGIVVTFGYPTAASAGIGAAVVGLNDDWSSVTLTNAPSTPASSTYSFVGQASTDWDWNDATTGCYVNYQQATSGAAPVVTVRSQDC